MWPHFTLSQKKQFMCVWSVAPVVCWVILDIFTEREKKRSERVEHKSSHSSGDKNVTSCAFFPNNWCNPPCPSFPFFLPLLCFSPLFFHCLSQFVFFYISSSAFKCKKTLSITIYGISEYRVLFCSVCVRVYFYSRSFFRFNPLHLLWNVFYVDVTCSYFFSLVQIQKVHKL